MAIYPRAVLRLKPHQPGEGPITPRVVILHSACGGYSDTGMPGLDWLLSPDNPLESHFGVDADGTVYQLRDTEWHSDANLDANAFAISVETESSIAAREPWGDVQASAIVELVRWCCDTHNIPRVVADRWDGTGIGYHTMWGAPSHWTPVVKDCPGPGRIEQFPGVVAEVEADDLNADQNDKLTYIYSQMRAAVGVGKQDFAGTVATTLATVQGVVNLVRGSQSALQRSVTDAASAVLAAVAALPTGQLSPEELNVLAGRLAVALSDHGIEVDTKAVLDALAARLAA